MNHLPTYIDFLELFSLQKKLLRERLFINVNLNCILCEFHQNGFLKKNKKIVQSIEIVDKIKKLKMLLFSSLFFFKERKLNFIFAIKKKLYFFLLFCNTKPQNNLTNDTMLYGKKNKMFFLRMHSLNIFKTKSKLFIFYFNVHSGKLLERQKIKDFSNKKTVERCSYPFYLRKIAASEYLLARKQVINKYKHEKKIVLMYCNTDVVHFFPKTRTILTHHKFYQIFSLQFEDTTTTSLLLSISSFHNMLDIKNYWKESDRIRILLFFTELFMQASVHEIIDASYILLNLIVSKIFSEFFLQISQKNLFKCFLLFNNFQIKAQKIIGSSKTLIFCNFISDMMRINFGRFLVAKKFFYLQYRTFYEIHSNLVQRKRIYLFLELLLHTIELCNRQTNL